MGLYLLNISVDTADPHPEHIPEDLSFNDQESIVEIVVEKILGNENAIKEYDDPDTQDHSREINVKIDLFALNTFCLTIKPSIAEKKKQEFPAYRFFLASGFQKLDTPPPRI